MPATSNPARSAASRHYMEGCGYDLVFAPAWLPSRSGPVWASGHGSGHPMSCLLLAIASDPGRAS